jgi:hypothetical protein
MKLMNGRVPDRFSLVLDMIFPVTLCVLFLLCACGSAPTWSTESRSPDGRMTATAKVFANGGFASPGPATAVVYLKGTTGSQKAMLIFAFSEGPPDSMRVKMTWLGPTHLELTYEGQHTVDFQAVKYAGVDISVRQPVPGRSAAK